MLRTIRSFLGRLLLIGGFAAAGIATAQTPPAPPQEIRAAPGRSGGEGGTAGASAGTVTLRPATKENPILGSVVGQPHLPPTGDDPASKCLRIAYQDFSRTGDAPSQIIDVAVRPQTATYPGACVINGFIVPQIQFKMWLPLTNWNGNYMQNGCGGRCGVLLPDHCEIQVRRGYACLASDLGHVGTTYDNLWAIDNLEAQLDFGFRATHVASIIGKVITAAYYGQKPKYSYFSGASTGGRQALIEAQRFPLDFNGIVAGIAASSFIPGQIRGAPHGVQGGSALFQNGHAMLTADEIRMVHAFVLARCDKLDGLADGIIGDPRTCPFKPADLLCRGAKTPNCLMQDQVAALAAVYEPGFQPGSELGWIGAFVAEDNSAGRYIPKNGAPGILSTPTGVTGSGQYIPYAWIYDDASNVDLRQFKAAGGKLIHYQGWSDEVVNPAAAVDYYETVERVMGGRAQTQSFYRLFMVPGQSHIPGNIGAESVNYLYALEDWVEHGKAPDKLMGRKLKSITMMLGPITMDEDMKPANYLYSRPIYSYPIQAHYKGKGDPDDASNFGPWDPAKKKFVG